MKNEIIDVVFTWVDGNDPIHRAKMKPYLSWQDKYDDIAGKTRYASTGEIYYSVASVIRFARFIRKIFIITPNQTPKDLDKFIENNFPCNKIPIEIINQDVLFRGYEQILPVFNSLSVETFIWRIPGLSENFVYMCDDFIILRPISEQDWFIDDKIVAVGYWRNIRLDKIIGNLKPRKNGHKKFRYKDSLINAAKLLNIKRQYFFGEHTPMPMKKSDFEKYFTENPQAFLNNANNKFRHPTQFNIQSFTALFNHLKQKLVCKNPDCFLFLNHVERGRRYIKKKIRKYENDKNRKIKFCCIGSMYLAPKENQNLIFRWLQTTLDLKFTRQFLF